MLVMLLALLKESRDRGEGCFCTWMRLLFFGTISNLVRWLKNKAPLSSTSSIYFLIEGQFCCQNGIHPLNNIWQISDHQSMAGPKAEGWRTWEVSLSWLSHLLHPTNWYNFQKVMCVSIPLSWQIMKIYNPSSRQLEIPN